MNILTKDNTLVIQGIDDFDCTHTFLCGQCFRWEEEEDGSYTGIAFSKVINIACRDGEMIIKNSSADEFERNWRAYLDLDSDYKQIKTSLSFDDNVKKAMDFGWGIKILNQEIFECLISFIISTQNAIPRIKKSVAKLSEMYGDELSLNGKTYYAFPTLKQLIGVNAEDLALLRVGYRAPYIVDAVEKIKSGEVRLDMIKELPYAEAKAELMKIRGVGPKVADCVLLFSAGKKEAFPVDVWVKRTMQTLYLGEGANEKQISSYAAERFGAYAGVAQQYLFYYARENKLGV